jgi:CPA2 family monovalent cation:H+ antiporter-2
MLMTIDCPHADAATAVSPPLDVCPGCVETGGSWVNLRQCLTCGLTACCDASPNRHATGHWEASGHPLIRSAMPGEDWAYCNACPEYFS